MAFLGASMTEQEVVIVTELMQGGTLWRALHSGKVTWYKRWAVGWLVGWVAGWLEWSGGVCWIRQEGGHCIVLREEVPDACLSLDNTPPCSAGALLCSSLLCRGLRIAIDVARGLDYLHRRNIVHLDLKSPVGGEEHL